MSDTFQIKPREPLFFMHIPKTAGMSMRLYLSEQYDVHDICPFVSWEGLPGREDELGSYRLVQGHFHYNIRDVVPEGARMLVMLRDPLRRTISALRHLQRDPSFHADHELAKDLTLASMIRHPDLMRNQNNVQARFLCASEPAQNVGAYLEYELPGNSNADPGDIERQPTFRLAAERLEAIEFIGLTEDISGVVSYMAQEMKYHPPLYFPVLNEDPARVDPLTGLTEDDLTILREYNDIDLQVYDYAKRLIERRVFERGMDRLVNSGVYEVPPGSFTIPIDGIMPGSGWYEPERQNDVWWRWTGPGRSFTVEVPLRQDASYQLILTFVGKEPEPDDIVAHVNDLPLAFGRMGEASREWALPIPRPLLAQRSGFCRIRFDLREVPVPVPPDLRALGVAVRQIAFECLES